MVVMLMIIIIKCLLSLLCVPGEYQAAALRCDVEFVDSANGSCSEFSEAYLLALGVQGGGSLIKEQDLRVTYDCPGDGNALLLATR